MSDIDVFAGFSWHSSVLTDETFKAGSFITRLPNNRRARAHFITAGENHLIHRSTRALWRLTDDKKHIEPMYGSDILTEEDLVENQEAKA